MIDATNYIIDHKRRGEWAELRFMADATHRGLTVSKPWGDSEPYDVTVEHNGQFQRVQVKSALHRDGASYHCGLRNYGRAHGYQSHQLDFFAILIVQEELWYILPVQVALISCSRTICLTPSRKGNKYDAYKEAWHLLMHPPKMAGGVEQR